MREGHRGGGKCFVDYAGKKQSIIDAATSEVIAVELFVAVGIGSPNWAVQHHHPAEPHQDNPRQPLP